MKSLIVASTLALAAAFAGGVAMAAPPATSTAASTVHATKVKEHTSNGVVKSYTASSRRLMLKSGLSYKLNPGVTPDSFKTGDKVQIRWSYNGQVRDADQVVLKN